jgi:adenylate kinase
MYLILFGAPGVGKGTQAKFISAHFKIAHISTGEILREAVKANTELGRKAGELISHGKLVPDGIMLDLIRERIAKPDCKSGFILDGFPRTIVQAQELTQLMSDLNLPGFICIEITVPDSDIIKRLLNRRLCESCGTDYNLITNPPAQAGICDVCAGKIIRRKDDNEQTITHRLEVYQNQTAPLREYYGKHGNFYSINGSKSIEIVKSEIISLLENK